MKHTYLIEIGGNNFAIRTSHKPVILAETLLVTTDDGREFRFPSAFCYVTEDFEGYGPDYVLRLLESDAEGETAQQTMLRWQDSYDLSIEGLAKILRVSYLTVQRILSEETTPDPGSAKMLGLALLFSAWEQRRAVAWWNGDYSEED